MAKRTKTIAEIVTHIRRIFEVVHEKARDAQQKTGLTNSQLWAIKTIAHASPIMVSEIAKRMYLHPATVVGILNRLEDQKLITRTRTKKDRRVVWVELTEKGYKLERKAPETALQILTSGLEKFKSNNLEKIVGGLGDIVSILGARGKLPHLILSPEINWPLNKKLSGKPVSKRQTRS